MMRALILTAASSVVLLPLLGCADAKAPTEANFRKALEPMVHDTFCRTIDVQRMSLVASGETEPFPVIVLADRIGWNSDRAGRGQLEAAVQAKLLTRTASTAPAKPGETSLQLQTQNLQTYAITDKGRPWFRAVDRKTGVGMLPFPAVCAAQGEIVEVVRWTEPADAFGQKLTRVTYTVRGKELIEGMSPEQQTSMVTPRERTSTLTLASDGWRVLE